MHFRYPAPALAAALFSLLLFSPGGRGTLAAADSFSEGERLFMENKPLEASAMLEKAVREKPAKENAFLYLGIAYQQLAKYQEAVVALRNGLAASPVNRHLFFFNMGNCFYAQGKYSFAEEMYAEAVAAKPDYAPVFLNRANARMQLSNFPGAIEDYGTYLALDPATGQAGTIRKVMDLINGRIRSEELAKAQAEARRLSEEAAKQALLDSISKSLLDAAGDSTNLSAGTPDVRGYDDEVKLQD